MSISLGILVILEIGVEYFTEIIGVILNTNIKNNKD